MNLFCLPLTCARLWEYYKGIDRYDPNLRAYSLTGDRDFYYNYNTV